METTYHRNTDNTGNGNENVNNKAEKQNPLGFKEMLEKYVLIHWKWYVLSAAIASLMGMVYVRSQMETWTVDAKLLVTGQFDLAGSELSLLRQVNSAPSRLLYYRLDTESELIKSQALMERVVNKLSLHTTYTVKHFLRYKDIYDFTPYEVKLDSASLSRLGGAINVEIAPDGSSAIINGSKKEITKLPYSIKIPEGNLTIARREWVPLSAKDIAGKTIYATIVNPTKKAKEISRSVYAGAGKQIDIMHISITTGHPKKGTDILRTVFNIYNEDAKEEINRSATNTKKFIDARSAEIYGELSELEKEAEKYMKEHGITDVPSAAQRSLNRDINFEMRSIDADIQLNAMKLVEDFMLDPANKFQSIPNLGLTDPGLLASVHEYNALLNDRNRLANSTTEESPWLQKYNKNLELSREAIKNSMVNNRRALESFKKQISDQSDISQAKIQEIPRQQREYLSIQRQLQVKDQLYVFMLQKYEEASLTQALAVDKARILSPPDSAIPTGPKTRITLLLAFGIGLVFPFIIVFLLDWLNNTIQSRSDVERISKVPILTELGHNATGEIILNHDNTKSSDAELFRLMRTRLQFVLNNETGKVIVVTSTEPSEGKSYTSSNLSISLAKAGKKVVFLGMDLRKPQISKQFKLQKTEGISSYLSGMEKDFRNLIETKEEYPNLSFISAGITPPNPNELLMSDNLDKLIAALRKEFDYIVIDTAPLGAVSDTLLINRIADIVLYICRIKYSDISNLIFINRLYDDKSLNNPYLVLNDMKLESRYYYHRGYGYGYAYGYGHYYYGGDGGSKKPPKRRFLF